VLFTLPFNFPSKLKGRGPWLADYPPPRWGRGVAESSWMTLPPRRAGKPGIHWLSAERLLAGLQSATRGCGLRVSATAGELQRGLSLLDSAISLCSVTGGWRADSGGPGALAALGAAEYPRAEDRILCSGQHGYVRVESAEWGVDPLWALLWGAEHSGGADRTTRGRGVCKLIVELQRVIVPPTGEGR
jgi:hypothetical protein